uniref:Protein LSM14 A n=1 Tax=Meloidogyne hapla TaxID=6305 RepID=A0A1I8BMQ5_MELHA
MSSTNFSRQRMGPPPPYIGSKISLISQLDIRYEGTLHNVDPLESTISLKNVYSYGTEDRLTPVFVPKRNELYHYIVFKASDIKDLIVCEQPNALSMHGNISAGLPYDPAIVSISMNPPPEPKMPAKLNMMGPPRVGGMSGQCWGTYGFRVYFHFNKKPVLLFIILENYRFPNFQPQQRGKQQVNNSNALEVFDKDYDFEKANEQFREDLKGGEGVNLEQSEEKKETADKDDGCEDGGKSVSSPLAITANDNYSEFYNKQNSFFDNISCDALEKEAGKNVRPDWKRERQTNQETFGYSAVRSFFFQRRGVRRQYGGQRSFGGRPFSGGGHSFGNQMNLFV